MAWNPPYRTIRLRSATGETGGSWYADPTEPESPQARHARRELAAVQELEPRKGWRLEFRGVANDWHREEG